MSPLINNETTGKVQKLNSNINVINFQITRSRETVILKDHHTEEETLTLLLCKRAFVSPIARRCSMSSKATSQEDKTKGLDF